ncbi:MAG: MFS transporter [Desulfitobacterium hafniense]
MSEIDPKRTAIDVGQVIEAPSARKLSRLVVALCFIVMLVDGYDNAIISNAAPILMDNWNVSAAAFGPVFSAATFGWMVGATVFGTLADRTGRKAALVIGSFIFSFATLIVIFANSVSVLVVMRFIAGFGIGAAVPPAIVLTSEFAPGRSKAKFVTIMFSGFVVGGAVGSLLASWLIPTFGWHSMFIVGFVAPMPAIACLIIFLPESIRWLAVRGNTSKHRQALIATLKKMAPDLHIDENTQIIVAEEKKKEKYSIKQLFEGKLAIITPLLWSYYIISSLGLFFVSSWLPQLFVQQGYSVADASYWNGISLVFGIFGTVGVGFFLDKVGFKRGAIFPLFCAVTTALIGNMTGMMFIVIVSIASFFRNGEHSILTALAPNLYPVGIRSQADSIAISIAKIGSIAGPLVGGFLISMGMSLQTLFYIVAAPFILCTICCYALGYMYEKYLAPNQAESSPKYDMAM